MGKTCDHDLTDVAKAFAENYNIHHAHCFQSDDAAELKEVVEAKLDVIRSAIKGSRELTDQKFQSRDEATKIAAALIDKRLEEMGVLRHQLDTQSNTFLTKDVYDSKHGLIQQQLNDLRDLVTTSQSQELGRNKGIGIGWSWIVAGILFLSSVVTLVLNFRKF